MYLFLRSDWTCLLCGKYDQECTAYSGLLSLRGLIQEEHSEYAKMTIPHQDLAKED